MVTLEDLKQIVILGYLTDDMLKTVLPFIESVRYEERDIIFKAGDGAENFFMLKRGKVLLELRLSDKITVSVGSVKPGYSFGWSAMLGNAAYTTDAICSETCDVLALKADKIYRLLEADHELGYRMTQRLLRVVKKRLDHRTDQLIRVITHHPDMRSLFDSESGIS